MSNRTILTDCDGVLLDWEKSFTEWMNLHGHLQMPYTDDHYDIADRYRIPHRQADQMVREFCSSAWVRFLPVFRDARSGVAHLVESGYSFVCITSLSNDPMAAKLRMRNLEDVFGKNVFVDLTCLPTGSRKRSALEKYAGTGMYWIEDNAQNAVDGAELGLKSILIEHGHNAVCEHKEVKRVADWASIVNIIVNDR